MLKKKNKLSKGRRRCQTSVDIDVRTVDVSRVTGCQRKADPDLGLPYFMEIYDDFLKKKFKAFKSGVSKDFLLLPENPTFFMFC